MGKPGIRQPKIALNIVESIGHFKKRKRVL
jgi:hypothetical protein